MIAAIRKSKASTSGVYNVDVLSTSPTVLHGVQLVSTPATAAGTAWLASPTGVIVYRRGPVTVEVGTDGSDFTHDTRTARAEERVAVAVTRPSPVQAGAHLAPGTWPRSLRRGHLVPARTLTGVLTGEGRGSFQPRRAGAALDRVSR